ncbi:MAG: alpha/beta fold hydrolase [Pseudomonadota bacterium]
MLQIGGYVDKLAALFGRRHMKGWALRNPADAQLLELDNCWVRYRVTGNGPPLVLFPDAPLTLDDYNPIAEALAPHYTVVVAESPACGFSLPKMNFDFRFDSWTTALIATLEKLNLGPAVVVTPCVSGLMGIALANRRPDLVRALVVPQTAAWAPQRKWAFSMARLGLFTVPVWGQLLMLRFKHTRWDGRLRTISVKRIDEFLPNIAQTVSHGACYCLASAGMYTLTKDAPADVRPVCTPALSIWGTKDRGHLNAGTDMTSIRTLLPKAEIVMMDDVGHFPEAENPGQFVRVLNDFIKRLP